MLYYRIDVLKALKDKGYTSTRIREEKILGMDALQKIRHGRVIGIIQLDTICTLLQCQPGDIIAWKDDGSEPG